MAYNLASCGLSPVLVLTLHLLLLHRRIVRMSLKARSRAATLTRRSWLLNTNGLARLRMTRAPLLHCASAENLRSCRRLLVEAARSGLLFRGLAPGLLRSTAGNLTGRMACAQIMVPTALMLSWRMGRLWWHIRR